MKLMNISTTQSISSHFRRQKLFQIDRRPDVGILSDQIHVLADLGGNFFQKLLAKSIWVAIILPIRYELHYISWTFSSLSVGKPPITVQSVHVREVRLSNPHDNYRNWEICVLAN